MLFIRCVCDFFLVCVDCSKRIVRIGGGESCVDIIYFLGGYFKRSLYCNYDGFFYYE